MISRRRLSTTLCALALLGGCDRGADAFKGHRGDAAIAADTARAEAEGRKTADALLGDVRRDAMEQRIARLELDVETLKRDLRDKQIAALVPEPPPPDPTPIVAPVLPERAAAPPKPPRATNARPTADAAPRHAPDRPRPGAATASRRAEPSAKLTRRPAPEVSLPDPDAKVAPRRAPRRPAPAQPARP